jgi:hypothetical protein
MSYSGVRPDRTSQVLRIAMTDEADCAVGPENQFPADTMSEVM